MKSMCIPIGNLRRPKTSYMKVLRTLLTPNLRVVAYATEVTTNNYEVGIFARNITDEDNIIGGIDFANLTIR